MGLDLANSRLRAARCSLALRLAVMGAFMSLGALVDLGALVSLGALLGTGACPAATALNSSSAPAARRAFCRTLERKSFIFNPIDRIFAASFPATKSLLRLSCDIDAAASGHSIAARAAAGIDVAHAEAVLFAA